ncbi:MAG TPA: MarR family transcriptional regulator [Actinocrinis sp.]|nr:MarR family transcriptional regulator [Actinocrinis sp.]
MANKSADELRQLFSDIVRLEIELWDAVDRRLRETPGISMGDFDVMRIVARTPSCRVYDIAEQLSVTVGGISKAVDRLERRGHVARRSNPGDRRSSLIELTSQGAQALAGAGSVVDDELELRLGSVLSADSLTRLGSLIARLRSGLAKPPDADRQ